MTQALAGPCVYASLQSRKLIRKAEALNEHTWRLKAATPGVRIRWEKT